MDVRESFIDNTLLISSDLIKMGYRYLKGNLVSITNFLIAKIAAQNVSGLVYDKYKDIIIEPWLGGKLAINGFLEDGRRIRPGDLGEGNQNYILAHILYELEKPKILL